MSIYRAHVAPPKSIEEYLALNKPTEYYDQYTLRIESEAKTNKTVGDARSTSKLAMAPMGVYLA